MQKYFIQQTIAGLAVSLSLGIGLHDTNTDKATIFVMASPSASKALAETAKATSDEHPHAEQSPLKGSTPHRHARSRERKHLKHKYNLTGGRQALLTQPL